MTSQAYLARFREILRERGWRDDVSPASLLDRWSALIEAVEDGYRWTLDEYLNELAPRDLLEALFADSSVGNSAEVEQLKGRVYEIDGRLRSLLRNDVSIGQVEDPWWRRGVLRFAGQDYAKDLEGLYGICVETV